MKPNPQLNCNYEDIDWSKLHSPYEKHEYAGYGKVFSVVGKIDCYRYDKISLMQCEQCKQNILAKDIWEISIAPVEFGEEFVTVPNLTNQSGQPIQIKETTGKYTQTFVCWPCCKILEMLRNIEGTSDQYYQQIKERF